MDAFYFEDFTSDLEVVTPERGITQDDVMAFAELSGDWNPLHTDPEFARRSPMGQPAAHGLLGISIATGLSAKAGHLNGTALGFLGMEQWTFHAPIFFGDRIRLRWTVIDTRLASSGKAGVVKRRMEIINQDGVVVQSGIFLTLVRSRAAAASEIA